MKIKRDTLDDLLHRHLGLSTVTPRKLSEASSKRILSAVVNANEEIEEEGSSVEGRTESRRWNSFLAAAAAAVFVFAVIFALQFQKTIVDARAVVETGDGTLLEAGRRIDAGSTVRTGDGSAVLILADGSRVEMRANSVLFLERASDGVRIRLSKGGVIINAAKQRQGHLYVQTTDVAVSVVGTVFLVNTETEGSRVAVIEGEVHVKQGAKETSLRPGEQVMTRTRMEWQPVSEEIAWSRHAEEHVALLQQTTAGGSQGKPRPSFEVASVKPIDPASMTRDHEGHLLDRERFVDRTELLQFIVRAYLGGGSCVMTAALPMGQTCPLLAGSLPSWIKTDRFEIQATMPPNSVPSYTVRQLHDLDTPELNLMLQVLLEERFHLKLHWEMKEIPVYAISIGKNGPRLKQTPLEGQQRKVADGSSIEIHGLYGINTVQTPDGIPRMQMDFLGSSMKQAAETFAIYFDRPVVDRTGLLGEYDFKIEYDVDPIARIPQNPFSGLTPAGLSTALQAVGLNLESTKASVEILVIDHVEKPSEN
jgi:uncharacterized protein (TIGR03435 family)